MHPQSNNSKPKASLAFYVQFNPRLLTKVLWLGGVLLTISQSFSFESNFDSLHSLGEGNNPKYYHLKIGNQYIVKGGQIPQEEQDERFSRAGCCSLELKDGPDEGDGKWLAIQKEKATITASSQAPNLKPQEIYVDSTSQPTPNPHLEKGCFYFQLSQYIHNNFSFPFFLDGNTAREAWNSDQFRNNVVYLHPFQYSDFQIWKLEDVETVRDSNLGNLEAYFFHPRNQRYLSYSVEKKFHFCEKKGEAQKVCVVPISGAARGNPIPQNLPPTVNLTRINNSL